VEEIDHSLV
jgi:hypothetical protein